MVIMIKIYTSVLMKHFSLNTGVNICCFFFEKRALKPTNEETWYLETELLNKYRKLIQKWNQ